MARGTTCETIIIFFSARRGVDVTGQTICSEFLNHRIRFGGWIESLQRNIIFIGHSENAELCFQAGLRAKRVADVCNCSGVRGLDAGHHALDVILILRFAAGMTVAPATRLFHH